MSRTSHDGTEVVLVRHGATAWTGHRFCGLSDPPLDADGRRAVAELAVDLTGTLPAGGRIVTSPLRRARQTAEAIATALGEVTVAVDDRWAETDFGHAEGRTFAEVEVSDPDLAAALLRGETMIDWPGGESAAALAERVQRAWIDLGDAPGPVIVVSHAGPLRIAMALADGIPPSAVALFAPGAIARRSITRRTG